MSRWFIFSQYSDPYKPKEISNKPYNNNQTIEALPTGETNNNTFEGNEQRHDEVEIESREADTVFGVDKDGKRPFITIFDGHK